MAYRVQRQNKSEAVERIVSSLFNLLVVLHVVGGIFYPHCFAVAQKLENKRDVSQYSGLEGLEDRAFLTNQRKLSSSDDTPDKQQAKKRSPMLFPLVYRTVNLTLKSSYGDVRRSTLGSARAELLGHVRRGYYFTRLLLGTPPKKFELIVDTGSTVTYVPCSNCEHCGKHADNSFVPANSSTYEVLHCADRRCRSGLCAPRNTQCMYDRHYAEDSSSTGLLAIDNLSFGDYSDIGTPRIIFGCETDEEGALYQQIADGILGLGKGPLAVPNQLASSGTIDDSFSLCYGGMVDDYSHAGAMIMGAITPPPGMVYAITDPSKKHSQYYNLRIEGIQVEGVMLDVDPMVFESGYGTLLDSGTTFTYLPTEAFDAFHAAVVENLRPEIQRVTGPDKNYPDICFGGATSQHLEDDFPHVDIVFYPKTVVSIAPENYLFKHHKQRGAYCFGFFDNGDEAMGTLLGGILTRNMLVNYDRQNNRIGFLQTSCKDLMTSFPEIPNSPNQRTTPPPPKESSHPPPRVSVGHSPPPLVPSPPPLSHPPPGIPPSPPTFSPPTSPPPAPPPTVSTCEGGCVQQIVVGLNLNIPKDSFVPLIPGFINDLASKINVNPSQIEVSSYESGQTSNAVVLKCIVHPTVRINDSFPYFSETAAQEIAVRLRDHKIKLREIFGAYKVISVDLEPPRGNDQERDSQSRRRAMLGAVGGAVGGALITTLVGLVIVWRRRRSQVNNQYLTVDQGLLEEEAGALL